MSAHTPGPWRVADSGGGEVLAADGKPVAFASAYRMTADDAGSEPSGPATANARLIAAAPEMLAALKPLAFCDERQPPYGVEADDWNGAVLAARAAIAKAQGRDGAA